MSKKTGKSWSEGYHRVPNTLKYLAGDPDIKFVAFVSENSEDDQDSDNEEIVSYINQEFKDSQSEVKEGQTQQHTAIKEIHLDPLNSGVDSDSSSTINDIPLSPATREDIIEYLNCYIEDQLNKEDEC